MDGLDWHPAWGLEERKAERRRNYVGISYVAIAAPVVLPSYPPTWSIRWWWGIDLWPGPPFPPGYEPSYTVSVSAPAEMDVGQKVEEISTTANDYGQWGTSKPGGVNYSATLQSSGRVIQMKYEGGSEYKNTLSGEFEDSGDSIYVHEADPIFFDVTSEDAEDYILLKGIATINGREKQDTTSILINSQLQALLYVTYEKGGNDGTESYVHETTFAADSGESLTSIGWSLIAYQYNFPGDHWVHNKSSAGDVSVVSPVDEVDGTASILIDMEDSTYQVMFRGDSNPGTGSASYELYIYESGELQSTTLGSFDFTDAWAPPTTYGHKNIWVTIDGATGEVTVVNDNGPMENGSYTDPLE